MLEKVCVFVFCLFENIATSIAIIRPRIVTRSAVSFIVVGIVSTCVFIGEVHLIINIPAIMLPHASRVMGLVRRSLFSLIGDTGRSRGLFIEEKKIIRKL